MNILLAVCGGIAAFKSAQLVSDLVKRNHNVQVIMTKNACEFISPLTLSTLSKNPVFCDMFLENDDYSHVKHIELAKWAQVVIVVPATANMIAKLAHGIADDLVSTTILAINLKPIIIIPAMNTMMLNNQATVANLDLLALRKYHIMESDCGLLACGDVGKGKIPELDKIIEYVEMIAFSDKRLLNKKVLISAGPTVEAMDPVRFISNHSSGKMGYALAKVALKLGAEVILVSGPTNLKAPLNAKVINVFSACEMLKVMKEYVGEVDYVIMAGAVADYRPKHTSEHKIKKEGNCEIVLELVNNPDIISSLIELKSSHCKVCGFAMESRDLVENGLKKLKSKKMDMIVCNNILDDGAGFGYDTNIITIIDNCGMLELPIMSKEECAFKIIDHLINLED